MSEAVRHRSGDFDVVVVGSANIDLFYEVDRFAAPNETMHATSLSIDVGGKGLNQAIAAARSGARVAFIGAVGTDPQADLVRQCLKDHGIPLDGLREVSGQMTGSAAIMVAANGDNMITLAWGANGELDVSDVAANRATIEGSKVLLVQGEVKLATSKAALQLGRSAGLVTIFNPAPAQVGMAELIPFCDVVTPNETEASHITGLCVDSEIGVEAAVLRLLSMGAKQVILTRGSRGYALGANGKVVFYPAQQAEAVDTTGAGDVFNGVLASTMSFGNSIESAAERASFAAAIAVQRRGAMRSAPTFDEIEDRMCCKTAAVGN